MKYMTIAIMAVLIFGVAASPVLSNGFAYAQDSTEKTEKEKKQQRSDESKQQKVDQTAKSEDSKQTSAERKISKEKHAEDSAKKQEKRTTQQEKRTTAQELQDQRRAELEEKNRVRMQKLAAQESLDLERMQERLDKMQDRSPMTEAMDKLNKANSLCGLGTIFDPNTNSCVLDLVDTNTDTTQSQYLGNVGNSNGVSYTLEKALEKQRQRISTGEILTYFDDLQEMLHEHQRSQALLYKQMSIMLELVDNMCEGKRIVIQTSNDTPRCLSDNNAKNLVDRGLATYLR